jgi:hypothetical protein
MSHTHELEVNDLESDSVDTQYTNTMQTPSALQALPAELIGMISKSLNNKSLLAMRSTCRDLCGGSARAFCHRFLDLVEISCTWDSVLHLNAMLSSRNLPYAQHTVKKLVVSALLLKRSEKYEEPDTADVARLVHSMPNLTTVKLIDDMNVAEQIRQANTARIFLSHLAKLPSRVRRLDLFAVQLDGELLAGMLEAHANDLLVINFNLVILDSFAAWQRILGILLAIRVKCLEFAFLQYTNREGSIEDLAMLKGVLNRRISKSIAWRESGEGIVGDCLAEASGNRVKPVLEYILRQIEDPA